MKLDIHFDSAPGKRPNFRQTPGRISSTDEASLAREHLPLVSSVVNRMRSKLPANADLEELHSIGVTGLMSAVKRFDSKQAITFRAYAATRIRGAILDALRKMDSLPRTRRAKLREIKAAVEELEQQLGRTPRDEEIAAKLDLSVEEFQKLRERVRPHVTLSLDSPVEEGNGDEVSLHEAIADERMTDCSEAMEQQELIRLLGEHVSELPDRQRQVVSMYYFEEMRLAEIAEVFGVTEARVCQIHTQAVASLRKTLSLARAG